LLGGKARNIDLDNLEKICISLQCTPNDLLEWHKESDSTVNDKHPLNLLKPKETASINEELKTLPLEKMDELKEFIKKLKEG
jgi:hypothetical protein